MKPKHYIIIVLAVLALILIIQNAEAVPIQFFFWTVSLSRIISMIVLLFIGFLIGWFVGRR